MASMEENITGLNKFVEDAFNKRDFEEIRAVYADDVRMMVPGRPLITGIDGTIDYWKNEFGKYHSMNVKVEELIGPLLQGDTLFAIERGSAEMCDESGKVVDRNKFVLVGKKIGDDWKAFLNITNFDTK